MGAVQGKPRLHCSILTSYAAKTSLHIGGPVHLGQSYLLVAISVLIAPGSGPRASDSCPKGVGELAYQNAIPDSTGRDNVDIFVICTDGTGRRRLTDWAGLDAAPVWSPDRKQLAFHSNRDARPQRGTIPDVAIYIMNSDGSGVRRVINRFGMNPTWSPDGQWLAFVSLPELSPADSADVNRWTAQRDIFIVRTDGTALRNLTNAAGSDNYPAWSPDGRQLAFSSRRTEGEDWTEIYVITSDGMDTKRLTFNKGGLSGCCEDAAPTWSPDSQWLAFISKRDGNSEVYKMRRDGSQPSRLTRDSTFDGYPSWSANGQQIVFEKHRAAPRLADGPPRTPDSLYVMQSDGTARRPLRIAGTRPQWRP